MATKTPMLHLRSLAHRPTAQTTLLSFLAPSITCRYASGLSKGDSRTRDQPKRKRKARTEFINHSLKQALQFSLCDAMRYIHAFEVGRPPDSPKYDLAIRLRTLKNGPAVRNRVRLPHAVDTSVRICVICPPDSPVAKQAISAGASLVGEESIFDAVKEGRIEFDRCICHINSLQKLNEANLGRILGPKGLMPSVKLGTVTKDVKGSVANLIGASEYRERLGVIRLAVGQLGFTPEQMQNNVKALIANVKKDLGLLSEKINKEIHEVVLSSTHAPGFSLNGEFKSPKSPPTQDLSVL